MLFKNRYNLTDRSILAIAGMCLLPLLLNLFGADFGTVTSTLDPYKITQFVQLQNEPGLQDIFYGQNFHTIFVSFAITVAFLTAMLSFIDFSIKGEISTPIVGIALFCAGLLDVFHILVSTQIISLADEQFYVTAFTWFFCRLFHPTILILGVGIFLMKSDWFLEERKRNARRFAFYIGSIFVSLTFLTIILLINNNTTHPGYPFRNFARPYDLIPLALYLVLAFYFLPKFYQKHPSIFSQTLLLSMIPAIATQLYMAFGSREMFDNGFNIAHFMTAFTYFIPFLGLGLNYLQAYKNEKEMVKQLHHEAKEKQRAQKALMDSQKLNVTGKLARTIAHEVRNPLTNINMSLEQLKDSIETDGEATHLYIDIIKRNSDRINQLITELLNVSRPTALNMQEISVNEVLEDTLQLAKDRIHLKRIKMEKHLDIDVPYKMLDPEKIKTAFLNIIINAVEAMDDEKGVLTINTKKGNGHCIVEIADNGHGMSEDDMQHLFQPFFSQKTKGMGLGLTATQNIILTHKGSIDVESREGQGTKFTIAL